MGVNTVASFRQKRVVAVGGGGDSAALEGFWGGRGGFVFFLRDVALRWRVVRVSRRLRGRPGDGGRRLGVW